MSFFGEDDTEKQGRFRFDDDVRQALDDMTNADEAVELLDMLADHQESIEDAVTGLDALHRSGFFDLLRKFDPEQTADVDFSNRPNAVETLSDFVDTLNDAETRAELEHPPMVGPFEAMRQLRDPDVRRGLGRVLVLLRAIGRQHAEK